MRDTSPLMSYDSIPSTSKPDQSSSNKNRYWTIFWSVCITVLICIFGVYFTDIIHPSSSSSTTTSSESRLPSVFRARSESDTEPQYELKITTNNEISTYKGAVLEYQVIYHKTYWTDKLGKVIKYDPVTTVPQAKFWQNINIRRITPFVVAAAEAEVDVLVLPEFALNGLVYTREEMALYLEKVPDPDDCTDDTEACTPCDNEGFADRTTLQQLSCLAKDNGIYLVVNYGDYIKCDKKTDEDCPTNLQYQYNTQIVFNAHGVIVAKYYKIHTYEEDEYDVPETEDYVTFTMTSPNTGAAVEIGLVVCYDTMYGSPFLPLIKEGVTNFVMSHWWVNTAPTLNILEWTQAVSQRYGINLLFAASTWWNSGYTPSASSGSGILTQGTVITDYYNANNDLFVGKLLIGDVPLEIESNADSLISFPGYEESEDSSIATDSCTLSQEIARMIPTISDGETFTESVECTVGDDTFKCEVEVAIDSVSLASRDPNWLFVYIYSGYYGTPDGGDIYYKEHFCSVFVCDRDCKKGASNSWSSRTSFSSIKVTANFGDDSTLFVLKGNPGARSIDDIEEEITANDDGTYSVYAEEINQEMMGFSVMAREFPDDTRLIEA